MLRLRLLVSLLLLSLPLILAGDPPAAAAQPGGEDPMAKHMNPTTEHQILAEKVGKWKTEISLWMDPSQPAVKSSGEAEYTMILGGRFQQSNYTGDFMGMKFHGIGIDGYNTVSKVFTSYWCDNMGTWSMYGEGSYDAAKKEITLWGKMSDPTTGKMVEYRNATRMEGKDKMIMEMFIKAGGTEIKTMEIVHTRI